MDTQRITNRPSVNNTFYDTLGERWFRGQDHPIALLRAEARFKNRWALNVIGQYFGTKSCNVLDLGCGAGLLANAIAKEGHHVVGIDLSENSLDIARSLDGSDAVDYLHADVTQVPFKESTFDVVCAMDLLEHVEEPERVIAEAARVLKLRGLFLFHTFNRSWASWLVVVKGVQWFIRNTPERLHVQHLFIKPDEMRELCSRSELEICGLIGIRPRLGKAFLTTLISGVVDDAFEFVPTQSLLTGYLGYARRV